MEDKREGSSNVTASQEINDEFLLNMLNEAKESLIGKCSENYQRIIDFIQLSFDIIDHYNYLPDKTKRSLENEIFSIKSLSEDVSKDQYSTLLKLKHLEKKLKKYKNIGLDMKLSTSNNYCFYYTKPRSIKEPFSRIVSFNLITKSIKTICKGNRFKNCSLTCRLNENLVFIYFSSKKSLAKGPILLNLQELLGSEYMKTFLPCSTYEHYHSAFILMENNELGFFGAQQRNCESFNYILKTWKNLKSFPYDVYSPTGAFYNGVVFIVDFSTKFICKYSQNTDSYDIKQSSILECETQKLLFCVNNKLYLLQGIKLFIYHENDFVFVRELEKPVNFQKVISFPIYKEPKVYFLTNFRKVLSILINI